MKLSVIVSKKKDIRGRIMEYTARFGNWEASGPSAKDAESALASLMERMANEDSDPVLRLDPNDGHVWMVYRQGHGDWAYGHYRTPGAEFYADGRTAPIGYVHGSGWTVGSKEASDRKATVEMMDRHLVSLLPSAALASEVR